MALINCPECDYRTSDQAEKCPNCAYPIKASNQIVVKSKEGCFLQTLNAGCMIVVLTIIAIIFFGTIISLVD